MKKLIPLILIPFLQACGDAGSDTELPTIKAKSAYTCSQYNEYRTYGDRESQRRMISATIQQLDNEYTGESRIEKYYRAVHSTSANIGNSANADRRAYSSELYNIIDHTCLINPDNSLATAVTNSINKFYVDTATQPYLATCQSYLEGSISLENILSLATEERYYLIINPVKVIAETPDYGIEAVTHALVETCTAKPYERVWSQLDLTANKIANNIRHQQGLLESQEREKARLKFELETYGVSLFKTGNADCRDYQTQYEKSQQPGEHQAQYKAALLSTLTDAGELLTPRQRVVFDKLLADNPEGFASALLEATHSGHLGSSPCYKERKGERRKGVELKDAIESMDNIPAAIEPKPLTQNQLVPLGR